MNCLRYDRRATVFRTVNLLVLLVAIGYTGWAGASAGRYAQPHVTVVTPVINDDSLFFNSDDFETDAGLVVTERVTRAAFSVDGITAYTPVSVTGRDYFEIMHTRFTDGGPWMADGERAVVLNESLAWLLYGNLAAAGQTLRIGDAVYTVAGVAAQGSVAKDNIFAWITPAPDEVVRANVLYYKPAIYNRLDAYLQARELVMSAGLRAEDYTVTDLDAYAESISLRGKILVFLAGLFYMLLVALYLYRLIMLNAGNLFESRTDSVNASTMNPMNKGARSAVSHSETSEQNRQQPAPGRYPDAPKARRFAKRNMLRPEYVAGLPDTDTAAARKNWLLLAICICASVVTVCILTRHMAFDFWVPAYRGEGMKGFFNALFNVDLLSPRRYLSYNLAAMYDLNIKAGAAFGAGLAGLAQLAFFTQYRH